MRGKFITVIDMVDVALPDVLMVADLFISDANSPSEEVLFYNTPQLLTGLANSSYVNIEQSLVDRGMGAEDIAEVLQVFDCAPVYADEAYGSWAEAVAEVLSTQIAYAGKREACFTSIFGQRDKQAGKRVTNIIQEMYLS